MVLAIEIGNTNVVIGGFENGKICFTERLSTNRNSTASEYAMSIKSVLDFNGLSDHVFDGAILSSVVPMVTNAVKLAAEKVTGREVIVVGPGVKTGLKILLDNPNQLGSDRVADAVAATHCYPCPLITIDLGTATTVSVVDADKNFIGGMIIPGVMMSLDSLANRTSQLPHISLDPPKRLIGRNTVDCMRSGIIYATAGSIDGLVDRIEEELGQRCTLISTGGLSKVIAPFCRHRMIMDDQLLLKGLMIIYDKNKA